MAAVAFAVSAFVFFSLVIGNYLAFSPSPSIQRIGSYFLTPTCFFSVAVLRVSPFDQGLWAFSSFALLLASLIALKRRESGWGKASLDVLTILAPAILLGFEVGIFFFIPEWFNFQATNFVARWGLGGIVTNSNVLVVSAAILGARLQYGYFARVRVRNHEGPKRLAKMGLGN
jgi:hypothetical protein